MGRRHYIHLGFAQVNALQFRRDTSSRSTVPLFESRASSPVALPTAGTRWARELKALELSVV